MKKKPLVIREYLSFIAGDAWESDEFLLWPPDVFAACASILEVTGTYTTVVHEWPPCAAEDQGTWIAELEDTAHAWRQAVMDKGALPTRVRDAWQRVRAAAPVPMSKVRSQHDVLRSLLELTCIADAASENFGLLDPRDAAEEKAVALITSAEAKVTPATLCERVHSSRVQVLPKQHTPQAGICLRSLSHHLALIHPRGIAPRWHRVPTPAIAKDAASMLRILCVPWPFEIPTSAFRPASPAAGRLPLMAPRFGFFEYDPPHGDAIAATVLELLAAVDAAGKGPVHILVLPELSLCREDYEDLREQLGDRRIVLIAGISDPSPHGEPARNVVRCDFIGTVTGMEQAKHHRWLLDEAQIQRYALPLDTATRWWEHSTVNDRQLAFITMTPQLTLCVLICEDLARQDPAPDLIRAVGPTLVISLLLDGPQFGWRWPGRFAGVLAEDPGSTVLTLTSLGMVLRTHQTGGDPSRAVALYRDPTNIKPTSIDLPDGHRALLLTFATTTGEEWTADGRSDKGVAGRLTLHETWPVI